MNKKDLQDNKFKILLHAKAIKTIMNTIWGEGEVVVINP